MAEKRIICIDDEQNMRHAVYRVLHSRPYEVVLAKDGEEAIRLFDRGNFDLVVTDWNMPKRTGLDVIRAIRAKEDNVPIVMVTAESEGMKRTEATDAGASDYCTKPLDAAAFRSVLAKHINGLAATCPGYVSGTVEN